MYLMLCGCSPFVRKDKTLAYEIINSPLEFCEKEWSQVSYEGKAIVAMLLAKNQDWRPSAAEALTFPWFNQTNDHHLKRKISLRSIENLRVFQCQTKIQQATLEYIVSHLATTKEVKDLQETFMVLDVNGDGKLSIEEISNALCHNPGVRIIGINEILKRCDSDHSGFIDYTEFLSASMDWKIFLCNEKLEAAFRAFDLDGNGVIDLEELKEMISGIDEVSYHKMMSLGDRDGNGGIDIDEFKEICLKITKNL